VAQLVASVTHAQVGNGRSAAETSPLLVAATVRNQSTLKFFVQECLSAGLAVFDATEACLRPVQGGHVHPALPLLFNSMHGSKAASGVDHGNVRTLVLIVSHGQKYKL
jgi:hypothetical protein